jgi:hypothetical protein
MKKVLLIVLLVIAAPLVGLMLMVGTCTGGLWLATSGVVEQADKLVKLAGKQQFHEAYALTSSGLRGQADEAAFTASLKQLKLDRAISVFWNARQVANDRGSVAGTVKLGDGGEQPVAIDLVKEKGVWKIDAVHPPSETPAKPGEQQL